MRLELVAPVMASNSPSEPGVTLLQEPAPALDAPSTSGTRPKGLLPTLPRRLLRSPARRIMITALLAGWLLTVNLPQAHAMTPSFTITVEVDGESVLVRVEFREPIPGGLESSGVLERLAGWLPAELIDERGRPLPGTEPSLIALTEVGDSRTVFESRLTPGPAGRYAVLPWPLTPDYDPDSNPGYGPTVIFETGQSRSGAEWAIWGSLVAGAGLVWFLWRRRSGAARGRPSAETAGPPPTPPSAP